MDASQKSLPFTVDFNLIFGPTFIDFVFVAEAYIYIDFWYLKYVWKCV